MQNQPDWGKRGVWAAYIIGVPSVLLGFFAYFRPPDPMHPIGLSFLFRTVSVPTWLIAVLLLVAIGLSLAFKLLSRFAKKSGPQPNIVGAPLKPHSTSFPPEKRSASAPVNASDLVIEADNQLEMHFRAEKAAISFRVNNNRLDAIHHLDVIVHSAFSFNASHHLFRTHAATGGARMQSSAVVGPSESSQAFILVYLPSGKGQLQLGNDATRTMKWPENDKANVQRWKLDVLFQARAYSNTLPPTGEVFQPTKFALTLEWNVVSSQLSIIGYEPA